MASDEAELLALVGRGDPGAAERLYRLYRPYLLAVVRRRSARARTRESSDVVQSVWVRVVRQLATRGLVADSEPQLRGLLAVIARRRLADRARAASRRPAPAAGAAGPAPEEPGRLARPSEVAVAHETWARLLELCPPEHRNLLHLRRQGLTLTEVAERAGMHDGSVRRVFRHLARAAALRGDPE